MHRIPFLELKVRTLRDMKRYWESIFTTSLLLVVWIVVGEPTARADPVAYKIGVGDVVGVKVLDEKEFSGRFQVRTDGTIDYPYLRKIEVKGLTSEELGKRLTDLLKDGYLSSPQVAVDVEEFNSQKVLVLGAVTRPGTYILKEETRVLDLISLVGGLAPTGGKRILLLRNYKIPPDLKLDATPVPSATPGKGVVPEKSLLDAALASPDAKPLVIDYFRLVHQGDFSQNILLQAGDILNVPKANEIFVLGNVGRPGPITYEDNMTILQAVTLAGGPTPTASTKSTYILRQTEKGEQKIGVRFDRILENKEKNVVLKADDVIVVPESFF